MIVTFLAIAIAYSDFSIGLISSIFLVAWSFISLRYIRPRMFAKRKSDI
jgi:hypothetical protein